jgi:hypothetical protein
MAAGPGGVLGKDTCQRQDIFATLLAARDPGGSLLRKLIGASPGLLGFALPVTDLSFKACP